MSSDLRSRCSSWVARLVHVSCRIRVRSPRVNRSCCLGPAGFRTHLNDDRVARPQRELLSTYRHPPGGIPDAPDVIPRPPWQRTSTCVQGSIRDGEGLERAYNCEHAGMRAAVPCEDFISMRRSHSLIRRFGQCGWIERPLAHWPRLGWVENPYYNSSQCLVMCAYLAGLWCGRPFVA